MAETGYSFGLALASHPFRLSRFRVEAPVAQWIEYCPPKAGVAGSIPAGRTTEYCFIKGLRDSREALFYCLRHPHSPAHHHPQPRVVSNPAHQSENKRTRSPAKHATHRPPPQTCLYPGCNTPKHTATSTERPRFFVSLPAHRLRRLRTIDAYPPPYYAQYTIERGTPWVSDSAATCARPHPSTTGLKHPPAKRTRNSPERAARARAMESCSR